MIDTHAHVNFKAYNKDFDQVIQRALKNKVRLINVGSQYQTSKKAVEMAERYQTGVYAAIGLHPIHAREEFDYQKYKALAGSRKVLAIGEAGLDYKKEYLAFKDKQATVFLQQLSLARELNLPLVFHCRQAHFAMLPIIKKEMKDNRELRGVVHCFTGKWPEAEEYLKMGLFLGFNGIIFKLDLDSIIIKTPLERILIETDCPYLTPQPLSGRNEPLYVKYVLKKIAALKKISLSKAAQQTSLNAKKLFNLRQA